MKLIENLSKSEKKLIINILEKDGFTDIVNENRSILFKKGLRDFTLRSTNFKENSDTGLLLSFDLETFLKNNYQLKPKYTKSLLDKLDSQGSVDAACDFLGWEVMSAKTMITDYKAWNAELDIDEIYEVRIRSINHVIVGDRVFEGDLSNLWGMISSNAKDLLNGTMLLDYLNEINY